MIESLNYYVWLIIRPWRWGYEFRMRDPEYAKEIAKQFDKRLELYQLSHKR